MINSRTRTAAMAAVLFALAGGVSAQAADEPKPAPQRPQLNPIDPNRLWQAIGPAIRAGRMPELFEQIQSNFSTAPRTGRFSRAVGITPASRGTPGSGSPRGSTATATARSSAPSSRGRPPPGTGWTATTTA